MKLSITWTVAAIAVAATTIPAFAVKDGGTLRMIHRDNAPSGSIHEEATNSVIEPFMGVFNNLVMFDQSKPINSDETVVPDLAASWAWDAAKSKLTFKLHEGVKWHDGKPFTSADVKCTFDLLLGNLKDRLRKNPRSVWYHNLGVESESPSARLCPARKIPMICSSLNRERYIVRLLTGDAFYPNLEEFDGLRS